MKEKVTLKVSSYPLAVKEFATQALNLKLLAVGLSGLCFILCLTVLYLVRSGPTVVALEAGGNVAKLELKVTDLQIEAAIRQFLEFRYTWDDKSISAELAKARLFVLPSLAPSFDRAMLETQKYVKEKKVKQRVYPRRIQVDLNQKHVLVIADRITEFDSLKAATEMKATYTFTMGDRSPVNPWGVYITKETEEVVQ
jgi:hypothetical protein